MLSDKQRYIIVNEYGGISALYLQILKDRDNKDEAQAYIDRLLEYYPKDSLEQAHIKISTSFLNRNKQRLRSVGDMELSKLSFLRIVKSLYQSWWMELYVRTPEDKDIFDEVFTIIKTMSPKDRYMMLYALKLLPDEAMEEPWKYGPGPRAPTREAWRQRVCWLKKKLRKKIIISPEFKRIK